MTTIPLSLAQGLRTKLADAIAGFKAYDVPGVCLRLGLNEGSADEAFNSKFKYARTRLADVDAQAALGMARKLLEEVESFDLAEIVAKIDELETPSVSEVTRRRIVAVFEGQPLASQIDDLELIGRIWPTEFVRNTPIGQNLALSSFLSTSGVESEWEQYRAAYTARHAHMFSSPSLQVP
ncbi:hypothetical protein [Rhizobium nepotum]|uniref:hypothetical protein n=1 Tax=Rhizobium nepotum TaxID=1035271 RepID=UPI003CE73D5F